MKRVSSIDGAVGEVVSEGGGRVCVRVDGELEWWNKTNAPELVVPDVSQLTPEQAAELLRRLRGDS